MNLTQPGTIPVGQTPADLAERVASYRPSFGDYISANFSEGAFYSPTIGYLRQVTQQPDMFADPTTLDTMSKEEWQASPYFREDIPFQDKRITAGRAKALADMYDDDRYREYIIAQRKAGLFGTVAGFGAQLAGGAIDPINYIPLGWAERAAIATKSVGRFSLARVGAQAAEVGVLTAATEPLIMSEQAALGNDMSWGQVVTDITLGAVTGGIIGGVGEAIRGVRAGMTERALRGTDALNTAVSDLANHRAVYDEAIDRGLYTPTDRSDATFEASRRRAMADEYRDVTDRVNPEARLEEPTARATPAGAEATPEQAAAASLQKLDPELAGIEQDVQMLTETGAISPERRAEYDDAVAESTRYVSGLDKAYESALTCYRRGELG